MCSTLRSAVPQNLSKTGCFHSNTSNSPKSRISRMLPGPPVCMASGSNAEQSCTVLSRPSLLAKTWLWMASVSTQVALRHQGFFDALCVPPFLSARLVRRNYAASARDSKRSAVCIQRFSCDVYNFSFLCQFRPRFVSFPAACL